MAQVQQATMAHVQALSQAQAALALQHHRQASAPNAAPNTTTVTTSEVRPANALTPPTGVTATPVAAATGVDHGVRNSEHRGNGEASFNDATTDAPTDAPTNAPTDAPTDAPADTAADAPTDAEPRSGSCKCLRASGRLDSPGIERVFACAPASPPPPEQSTPTSPAGQVQGKHDSSGAPPRSRTAPSHAQFTIGGKPPVPLGARGIRKPPPGPPPAHRTSDPSQGHQRRVSEGSAGSVGSAGSSLSLGGLAQPLSDADVDSGVDSDSGSSIDDGDASDRSAARLAAVRVRPRGCVPNYCRLGLPC